MPQRRVGYVPWGTGLKVQDGPFSSPDDDGYGPSQGYYGADAAIGQKSRELVLSGLDEALAESRLTPEMRAQRSNILSHGTIEPAVQFTRRMRTQDAADATDPSHPMHRLGEQEFGRKLQTVRESNVRPVEVAGQTQRDVAGIERETALDTSGDKLAGSMYDSDVAGQAAVERELANRLIGTEFETPEERTNALDGFMEALEQMRRRFPRTR